MQEQAICNFYTENGIFKSKYIIVENNKQYDLEGLVKYSEGRKNNLELWNEHISYKLKNNQKFCKKCENKISYLTNYCYICKK